ncbi:hypothetical protein PsYK624_053440 [Phanerochaete sordida]|uniref:F-box domain-containing protein n=1 Tax=Phanerochaete sordida TaxID=48140 RepID=A0A9P3LCI9_9APHY|nr:hypothetical protein PsYK624_053440 [Phanerochaete sordida]
MPGMTAEPDYGYIFGALLHPGKVSDANHGRFRIQDLPPELLAEVFHWYILFVYAARSRYRDRPTPYAWLVIRHVCRAWRAVALGYPHLSSYIYISDNSECVQTMLEQSVTALLHIYADPSQVPLNRVETQRRVLEHLDRIVFAQIALLRPDDDSKAPEIPVAPREGNRSKECPMRNLTVQCRSISRPFVLFSDYSFPRLQEFKSTSFPLPSYRALFPSGLRSLSLSRTVASHQLDDFVALLSSLSQLESLAVDDLLDLRQDGSLPRFSPSRALGPIAKLGRLTTVQIRDSCLTTGCYILQRIMYPGSAVVKQNFPGVLPTESVSEHVFEILLARFRSPDSTPPQTMLLSSWRSTATRVLFWDDRLSIQDVNSWKEDDASYELVVDAVPFSFLLDFSHHLPLSSVRAARLEELGTNTLPWRALLPRLTALEELSVQCDTSRKADPASESHAHAEREVGALQQTLLPALAAVNLQHRRGVVSRTGPSDLATFAHVLLMQRAQQMATALTRYRTVTVPL